MERLSVNISAETAAKIRRHKSRKGVTTTETVRRALALLDLMEQELLDGSEILLKSPGGGPVRQLWVP